MQYLQAAVLLFTALFGLVFGSFLNVCIYRIPKGETIVFGRSHCMSCGAPLAARDLVPVFSYVFLRGRCRKCGARISPRYAVVETLNAVLWVAALCAFGMTPHALLAMAFLSGLIVISFIDIDTKLVPTGPVLYLLAVGIVSCFFGSGMPFYEKLLGIAAAGGPLLLITLVSRGGMGAGDTEFAAAAGLLLGWKLALFSLFVSFILGGVVGAVLMLFAHKSGKAQMPFAPFLAAGMFAALFFGNTALHAYLALLRVG